MKAIRQIIQAYESACKQQKKAALATVVHIEGSAYRSSGARMLVTEDGRLTGAISGGCLEGDALRKALLVMMEEKPLLATYDTSDDDHTVLGVGLGCNGIISVLIEPIRNGVEDTPISLLQRIVEKRQPSAVVTFFTPGDKKEEAQGTCIAVNADGVHSVGSELPVPYAQVAADIQQALAAKASSFVQYPAMQDAPAMTAFVEYVAPVPALIVAGAGNDVLPLTELAELLGWDVTLMDGRPSYASVARFPSCQVIVSNPEEALHQVVIDEQTAILLMSHNYAYDKAILAQAIGSAAGYIGILGPAKKRERMLKELEEEGISVPAGASSPIYGPTGLDIGAETSEEIALSITAEIKAVFTKRAGSHLRDLPGKIHRRKTTITPSLQTYGILLLAAGESKRLGSPKQQLVYNGNRLLEHAVSEALAVGTVATAVVLGALAETQAKQLDGMEVDMIINEDYQKGMSTTIRKGVQYFSEYHPQVAHLLVMLCDQPHVDTAHLRALIHRQQATAAPVIASYYADRKGVPALFHQSIFPQLLALQGDTGAKHVIEELGDQVVTVAFPLGAVDIDTEGDYRRAIEGKPVNLH